MNKIIASLAEKSTPVLPVIQVERPQQIVAVGGALIESGMTALEITLRTDAGLEAIRLARQEFPDATICAGTVTNVEQVHAVAEVGAEFIVTPGITESLLEAAQKIDIPILPGIATPSELMLGLEAGLSHFKLFPAQVAGGMAMLKALHGPFPNAQFCPTGGLTADNYMDFLELPNVFCVGGSWMIEKEEGVFKPAASIMAARSIVKSFVL